MPKKKLTHRFIKGLQPPKKPVTYYDKVETGLLLRLSKIGTKSFGYRYKLRGKNRRFTIGKFPAVSLSDARKQVLQLKVKVNNGIDPQAEKNKKKKTVKKEHTFKDVANEFIAKHLPNLRKRTADEYQRMIEVYLTPLNNIPIKEITKNDILCILDEKAIIEKSPTQANRIRGALSVVFNFAIDRGLLDSNLINGIPTYKKGRTKRSRYYSPEEIQELWEWFDSFIVPTGQVFKMLLICGQRKTETMKMKWDNIRINIWTIPAELAKNGEPHYVPLSEMALQIIQQMHPITGDSDYVFCSPRKENTPIGSIKISKEKIQNESSVSDFRPHDLRRTVATYMAKLAVDRTVLGKILNHKDLARDSQITAIYDRHSYMKEKREAMNRWSNKLQQILVDPHAKITKID
jgi:integrase